VLHGAAEGEVDRFIGNFANKAVNLPFSTSPSAAP